MALITTSVTPTQRYTPFTGLSELQRAQSGIARAEDVRRSAGTWAAAGALDNRVIGFDHELDPDYGYIVMDCFAKFYASGIYLTMEASANFQIQTTPGHADNEIIETQLISEPSKQSVAGNTDIGAIDADQYNSFYPGGNWQSPADVSSITFRLAEPKPTALIFPFAKTRYKPRIVVTFSDGAFNSPAYNYYFYLRLLQYDISQGYNYVIQTPNLTR